MARTVKNKTKETPPRKQIRKSKFQADLAPSEDNMCAPSRLNCN
jgi:hypothetical protein